MIIKTQKGRSIDTAVDLGPAERHILQKLFAWQSVVDSISLFREKKARALEVGWNDSGPIRESRALSLVIQEMEEQILNRLKKHPSL
ncbi:hypothetical protein [Desulfospira joergensenii]|uniref:hypothetical protein n=1 Tax=Desulfospira joergensenii TaxID=53329 RepID=UPI0003B39E12|nr:hypothetical protein [Desulfospira joergensenii]